MNVVRLDNLPYICKPFGMDKIRTAFLYKTYFIDFYNNQDQKVKDKIVWTIKLIETIRHVPEEYLKHLEGTDGLYEIRIKHGGNIFRVFCFFDHDQLIVLTNGFHKKTRKTPRSEIERALKLKAEYEAEK